MGNTATSKVPSSTLRAELSHEHRPLRALTGIRAFAACWVVLYHFREQIVGLFPGLDLLSPLMGSGYLGVDLFFGLSGFILAYNYLHRLGSNGTWSDRARFLWLRFARVWPVHFFTLNVALVMWLVARRGGLASQSHLWDRYTPLAYVQNLTLTHIWFGEDVSFNFPAWSVSAEWFAYLLFPLLALVVVKARTLKWAWLGAVSCYALLGAASFTNGLGATGDLGMRVGLEFLAGCFLFRVSECTSRERGWRYLVPGSACGIVVGAVTIGATSHGVLLAPLFGLLILGLAKGHGIGVRTLSVPVMTFAGEASYALYMTHALVQEVALKLLPVDRFIGTGWAVRAAALAGYMVMVAAAAVLTYLFVEKPARHRLRSLRAFTVPRPSKRLT